ASANHSTAQGAINAACWAAFGGANVPLLLVCEDNGIGISVPTPREWIPASLARRTGLEYFEADGLDLTSCYEAACEAAELVRRERRPALLRLKVVRLLGHAGSDIEALYRSMEDILESEANDPLVRSARLLVRAGLAT